MPGKDISFNFSPVPSLARVFLAGPEIKFIFVLGPIGSTKTTTCLYKLLSLAAAQAPSPDGVRRTRIAIVRNTLVSLKQTVLKDALSLFGDVAEYRQQDGVIRFRIADIESEWLFLAMETPQDQRRLLSLQLSSVYVNEAREIDFGLLMNTFSRCGRFPSTMHGGVKCSNPVLLADSNMGVEGSELYDFLEGGANGVEPALLYLHQPGALSGKADWLQFLREGYYDDMMIGARKAWIDTHVHARWSTDASGEPVFADVFDERVHVAGRTLKAAGTAMEIVIGKRRPSWGEMGRLETGRGLVTAGTRQGSGPGLVVGFDPGVNPAAVITQARADGSVAVLAELHAANTLLGVFIDELLTPCLHSRRFAGLKVVIVADPTAINRAPNGVTARGMLMERGYEVELAGTNEVAPRLHIIEQALTRTVGWSERGVSTVDGERALPRAGLQIDPGCEVLIAGLAGKYRFKRRKITQELEEEPEKKHPVSDVMDCLGYALLGQGRPSVKRKLSNVGVKLQEPVGPRGWT